jgi:transcriptional regulator with GAF, ATPase, and Fis domain
LDGTVVHVHDVLADIEYSRDLALAGKWRAALAVPLVRKGKSVGALVVGKAEPRPFSDRQIQLLKTFAEQAVIAIENVRLFEAEQQHASDLSESLEDLSESLRRQTAIADVLKIISSSPGHLQPVFDAMLSNATRLCGAKFGMLYLSEGSGFRTVAMHNVRLRLPKTASANRLCTLLQKVP